MKKSLVLVGAIAISTSLITGCGKNLNQSDVSNAMVEAVVLPSYARLSTASQELNQALQNLVNNPTQGNFNKAKSSWRSARKTWEAT